MQSGQQVAALVISSFSLMANDSLIVSWPRRRCDKKKATKAKQVIPLYNLPTPVHTKLKDFLIGNHCGKRSVNLLSGILCWRCGCFQLENGGTWNMLSGREGCLSSEEDMVLSSGTYVYPPSCEAEWRPRTGILGGCIVVALLTIKQPSALMCLLGVHMPLRIETMGQNARSFQLRGVI